MGTEQNTDFAVQWKIALQSDSYCTKSPYYIASFDFEKVYSITVFSSRNWCKMPQKQNI